MRLLLSVLVLAAALPAATIYDVTNAGAPLPGNQGWTQILFGVSLTAPPPLLTVNSNAANSGQGGFSWTSSTLNAIPGFTLSWSQRTVSQANDGANGPDRSGFSVIVTDSTGAAGIEIGFWANSVWAQDTAFTRSATEQTSIDTTLLRRYDLAITGGGYALSIDNNLAFSGLLRNYNNAFYDVANFIFFGDNTTSARGIFEVGSIELNQVPEPSTLALLAAGLALLLLCARRR
jgi:hypothetical protein